MIISPSEASVVSLQNHAPCHCKIFDELGAILMVEWPPSRLPGGSPPGSTQRAVVHCVVSEL